METVPILLRRPVFVVLSLALAAMFGLWSRQLFVMAGKGPDFILKLGEHALQVSLIVLAGAALKEFVEWRTAARTDYAHRAALRAEFLRRLRAVHMGVLNSRDLMRAHKSPKTWTEQSRRLIAYIPELEEIAEDLRVAPSLFGDVQQSIIEGIVEMIRYLHSCRDEYVTSHESVDADWPTKTLADTIKERGMSWTRDFVDGAGTYRSQYTSNLLKAKLPMRQAVYAGSVPNPRLQPAKAP